MFFFFYQRLYIVLFSAWLVAVCALFVVTVWGNFDSFVVGVLGWGSRSEQSVSVLQTERTTKKGETDPEDASHSASQVIRDMIEQEINIVEEEVERVVNSGRDYLVGSEKENTEQPVKGGKVREISFDRKENIFITRLTTNERVGKIDVLWLKDPTLLVVDLLGEWVNYAPRIHQFEKGFIRQVEMGMHPDYLRVVFRFRDERAQKGKPPTFIRSDKELKITVLDPGGS